MPELNFLLRWPDGSEDWCYSPSTVIAQHLHAGQTYALPEFLTRSRAALIRASDRVEAYCGYRCPRAKAQLAAIETRAASYRDVPAAEVICLAMIPHGDER